MNYLIKTGLILACMKITLTASAQSEIRIDAAPQHQTIISRDIYGQFAEHLGHGIYGGVWVGLHSDIPNTRGIRNDVVKALREARIPLIRWPGGCFADEYHWMDGIGPAQKRPSMLNTNWGGVTEDNSFGTHEFMDLCDQIGSDAYVTGNLGSGTVRELSQWVEYMTSNGNSPMTTLRKENGHSLPWKLKYVGLGNESWGCGGNMTANYYTDLMKQYGSFVKNYPGNHLLKVACGANDFDYNWTETLMSRSARSIDGLSLHYYTFEDGWNKKGSATVFAEADWFKTMQKTLEMETLVSRHSAIMDKYDPDKRVGLMIDEWGNWFDVEPGTNPGFLFQQNTVRDAIVAATNLNIFNNHSDRVKMSCIAQMVNVLQALVLTSGKEMVLTPTYYVYQQFAVHQGATLLPLEVHGAVYAFQGASLPALNASASRDAQGLIHLTICNIDPNKAQPLNLTLGSVSTISGVKASIITGAHINDFNALGKQATVTSKPFDAVKTSNNQLNLVVPAHSVLTIELRTGA